jgi:hypothetical protein
VAAKVAKVANFEVEGRYPCYSCYPAGENFRERAGSDTTKTPKTPARPKRHGADFAQVFDFVVPQNGGAIKSVTYEWIKTAKQMRGISENS